MSATAMSATAMSAIADSASTCLDFNHEQACLQMPTSHLIAHTLKARELTVASASSFIIIISVGFLLLILSCVCSSAYYRRRLMRRGGWPEGWDAPVELRVSEPPSRPELWDVSVAEDKKSRKSAAANEDWADILPLAARVVPHDGDTQEEGIADAPLAPREPRWAFRLPSRERAKAEPRFPTHVAGAAEVAMLISMPALSVPQRGPVVDSKRSEYAVGILQAHFEGGVEKSTSR